MRPEIEYPNILVTQVPLLVEAILSFEDLFAQVDVHSVIKLSDSNVAHYLRHQAEVL